MKKINSIILIVIVILFSSCHNTYDLSSKLKSPKFIENELDFLGNYKTSTEINNHTRINYFKDLNLKTIKSKESQEFWIDDTLVYINQKEPKNEISVIELFKKKFILISVGLSGIATPDFIDRNDVIVIDINSKKVYTFSLKNKRLTRSVETAKIYYSRSKIYYGIVSFDLENNKIRISNGYDKLEFDIIEITKLKTQ